jgi:hypothetical protein
MGISQPIIQGFMTTSHGMPFRWAMLRLRPARIDETRSCID